MKTNATLFLVVGLSWTGLWFTPNQQGQRLMDAEQFEEAADRFEDPMRQGVAAYRAKDYERAEKSFARLATAEAEYNRGTCLIMLGKYDAAISRFDRALELRPNWEDAQVNRDIAVVRRDRVKQKGGDMGDQKLGADEIRFDKNKKPDGQETEITDEQSISNEEMQALWLRRVQTNPADFLKTKFAYQLAVESDEGTNP